jgi:phenylpropionate dioxygenase-like ring-hydroxylating dioxygenase large terminal subunit
MGTNAGQINHPAATLDLGVLIQGRSPGRALTRDFYTRAEIFERDLERFLLGHWFCAAHVSSLPRPGDFLVVELGNESVIIVRAHEGDIKALVNVCRHRGSRVCTAPSGKAPAGLLTCPYHAWTYDLTGRLVAARQMPDSFKREEFSLRSLPVRVVAGLVFTTFAAKPLNFSSAEQALRQTAGVHGWARAKVAYQEKYTIAANWKLAIENYLECYHCQPAHPEYSKRHVLARPAAQTEQLERAGRSRAEALGIFISDVDQYGEAAHEGSESVSVFRSALSEGDAAATSDGQRLAPLMGDFAAHDGNSTYFDIGPLSDFLAYADHGILFRFIPRAALQTEMEVIWLVDEVAVEGRDYDLEALTSLWKATSLEDKKIVEWNQAGVNSRFFEPGPYSLQESYAGRFVDWYLKELAAGTGR